MTVHPWVVLLKEFVAVFSFAEEDLSGARVNLRVLSDVVDPPLINGPAIVLFVVLLDFFCSVEYVIWVLY